MYLINSHRYKNWLPDFSGLDMFEMYGLFKTSETQHNWCMAINRTDGSTPGDAKTVWFDDNGQISDDSPVGNYQNITGQPQPTPYTTLGAIKNDGDGNWSMVAMFGHLTSQKVMTNNSVNEVSFHPFIINGVVTTDSINGHPTILCTAANQGRTGKTSPYAELDADNEWSVMSICQPDITQTTLLGMFSLSAYQEVNRFDSFIDMRTQKTASVAAANSTPYVTNYIDQQNTSGQKRVLTTMGTDRKISTYLNNTFQSDVQLGVDDYVNDFWRMYAPTNFQSFQFKGSHQGFTLHNKKLTVAQMNKLEAQINNALL